MFDSLESFGNRIKRRLMRRDYEREAQLAEEAIERLGSDYGGWHLPIDHCRTGMIAVCAGAGEDISFDLEIARKFKAKVFIVDPTPRAVSHVGRVLQAIEAGRDFSSNYKLSGIHRDQIHFIPNGLWSREESIRFYAPKDPSHVSHSALNLQKSEDYFEAKCLSLKQMMKVEGLERVDLLKLDIEGSEYEVLSSILDSGILPEVLCVEFDEGGHPADSEWSSRIQSTVSRLKDEGYRIVHFNGFNMSLTRRPTMA